MRSSGSGDRGPAPRRAGPRARRRSGRRAARARRARASRRRGPTRSPPPSGTCGAPARRRTARPPRSACRPARPRRARLDRAPCVDVELGALRRPPRARVRSRRRETDGDRGQRLAAKAEARDPREVLAARELARRVALEREARVARGLMPQPSSVTATRSRPPSRTSTADAPRAGVERVLDQLLHHRGRALDHLARRRSGRSARRAAAGSGRRASGRGLPRASADTAALDPARNTPAVRRQSRRSEPRTRNFIDKSPGFSIGLCATRGRAAMAETVEKLDARSGSTRPTATRRGAAHRSRAAGRRREDRIVGRERARRGPPIAGGDRGGAHRSARAIVAGPAGSEQGARRARDPRLGPARRGVPSSAISCGALPEALQRRELFGCAEGVYPALPGEYVGALDRARAARWCSSAPSSSAATRSPTSRARSRARSFRREGSAAARPLQRARRLHLATQRCSTAPPSRELPHHEIRLAPLAERPRTCCRSRRTTWRRSPRRRGFAPVGFTAEARARLLAEPWPGDVRELARARPPGACVSRGGGAIGAEALLLARDGEPVPSFKEAKRAFETPLRREPAAPLRRQHQPRRAARQEGPQGLLRRDPPHRRRTPRTSAIP